MIDEAKMEASLYSLRKMQPQSFFCEETTSTYPYCPSLQTLNARVHDLVKANRVIFKP